MSSRIEETVPAMRRPKSRKSIAHLPSAEKGNAIDKENMTADVGALSGTQKGQKNGERPGKKSRSKSIGPGGVDALLETTGNRRQSIAFPPPRSILKPTIPPLSEIPAHGARASPSKTSKGSAAALRSHTSTGLTGGGLSANPVGSNDTKSLSMLERSEAGEARALDPNVIQQNAIEVSEENARKEAEMDLKARREARRKSLANRRVSFAPEATLHTWDVVEYMQDLTASSASTNSTRRASSASSLGADSPQSHTPGTTTYDTSEPPSTPPEQLEETVTNSPAHQRDLHQKKRRRSSGIPPLNFNNPDDEDFSSSPESDGSGVDGNEVDAFSVDGDSDLNSADDSNDEETAMSIDVDENTDMSVVSARSAGSSTGSSARLEQALELAARQAVTQSVGPINANTRNEEEEVIASFAPWSKKPDLQNMLSSQDQENLNPFSPAFKAGISKSPYKSQDGDMTMDMTRAVGQIISEEPSDEEMTMDITMAIGGIVANQSQTSSRRKSVLPARRQSTRRRSSGLQSTFGDETMDFTMAVGGIQHAETLSDRSKVESDLGEDEEMTMELTSVIGGVLAPGNLSGTTRTETTVASTPLLDNRRQSMESTMADDAMDFTTAIGGIMRAIPDHRVHQELDDTGMEMTRALGSILQDAPQPETRTQAKQILEQEVDSAEPVSSPFRPIVSTEQNSSHGVTRTSATGSPGVAAFRNYDLRRSGDSRQSTTPRSGLKPVMLGTPNKVSSTPLPTKQITPKLTQRTSPRKTSPSRSVKKHSASPGPKLGQEPINNIGTPINDTKATITPKRLFDKDAKTGISTATVILTPRRRRSSGLGVDKPGLGSPHVAALLDRRESIGDSSLSFSPGEFDVVARGVRFDAPQDIEQEVDREREQELEKEDGRKIMEREADVTEDEKEATVSLKDMINSLTPKKKPLRGRKSLHVGAAKGILGKRPVELDEVDEDDDDDEGGVKRLRNHQGSPVKNVKLKAPPSKEETAGRTRRTSRRSLEATSGNAVTPTTSQSPIKNATATTPRGQGRFKDPVAREEHEQEAVPFVEKDLIDEAVLKDEEPSDDRMHLQDFLNMTSIRFMELTTTKRRYTVLHNALTEEGTGSKEKEVDGSMESCVVAGACTVPMLDLFQHSCRELKRYIAGGRSMVREIEAETFEENPPLFREYICATPDVRSLMDNQFKNVKTHARLLSKAMWYEWRMKLLEGLKDGLDKISEGMRADSEVFKQQQELLDSVLPQLIAQFEQLSAEEAELKVAAKELTDCDQQELDQIRQDLLSADADVASKKRMVAALQAQLEDKENKIQESTNRKAECLDDIKTAETIREECRGWTGNEIISLKSKVDDLEKQYGWTVTGVSGTTTSMAFRSELELVFDASAFKDAASASKSKGVTRIDLWYIADVRESNPAPKTEEKDFFLQNIREHCRCLPQAGTPIKSLLDTVSDSWGKALSVNGQIACLNLNFPTIITKTSDTSLVASASLLLIPLATKVQFDFEINVQSTPSGFSIRVVPSTKVVYGEKFNEKKMDEFMCSRIEMEATRDDERGTWSHAVLELEAKLLARGRK